ncbi:uncharacterized protein [Anas platyrhynchos]|uniref:uncharacterized protein n=1 Tax=Anas platyrhynchos TaxID=8839 RepID=UPI003AF21117
MAEAAVGLRGLCGAALVGLSWGAALVGRCCGAALVGLSRGAAALLGTPGFARAHALGVAALVGLEPALRRGADPHGVLASPHNLLEARLVASAGRWTALLLGSLLVASLPLAQPGGGRRGALLRAAGRLAVGATVMAAAAPRLFAALEAAAGLRPSPQAFGLVLCGLGLGEELGALGRLLHPPRGASGDARVATGGQRATGGDWVASERRMATGSDWVATDGWRATGSDWVATGGQRATGSDWVATNTRMATGGDWVATDHRRATGGDWVATNTRMATGDVWMATDGRRATGGDWVASDRRMATRDNRVATNTMMATRDDWMATDPSMATGGNWVATDPRLATRDDWMATDTSMATGGNRLATTTSLATRDNRLATNAMMAPGGNWVATNTSMAPGGNWVATNTSMATGGTRVATEEPKVVATAPLCLLFLLNAGLLLLWQGALVATLAYRCHWAANAAGAALGWAAWALTYRLWYRCPCSPGRPGLGLRPRGGG